MIDFKPKKIAKEEKIKSPPTKKLRISIPLIASLAIIIALCIGIVKAVSNINFSVFLKLAGTELKTDIYGHTNLLILGIPGEKNEGANLTDTIILASLDDSNKTVAMMSIPRDLYVKDEKIGNSKINEVYLNAKIYYGNSIEALEYLKSKIEEIMGIPIHYWVKIDFNGFKDLIDALGGIDVYVEEAIYDPYYPKDGTFGYQPFSISKGWQHIDGETALKYARTRQTTSDFDRASRQQQIIYAIKERALQTEIIFSKEKIENLLNTLKANIDTNIKAKEILTIGAIAEDYSQENIVHRLIHDDPAKCGGLLYSPEREYYNGMFVLIPAGGFEFIHWYADLNFDFPLIAKENSKIHILNGTKTAGVAGETKQILRRFCFEINRFGNAKRQNIEQTTYYYKQKYDEKGTAINSRPAALDFLQKIIPGQESTTIPQEYLEKGYMDEADIILEIGSDYVNSENYIEDPFYYLPLPKTTTTTESEELTTAEGSAGGEEPTATEESATNEPPIATPEIN